MENSQRLCYASALNFCPGIILLLCATLNTAAGFDLPSRFAHPPSSARPWVFWFWMNGNITSNGITADLEAMQKVGIGGVLLMEINIDTPKGPVAFGSREWQQLFNHACREARRLGMQVRLNNSAGYSGSGGPCIRPELSMQKVVWSETVTNGPAHFDLLLPHPESLENYYRDIAVLAVPTLNADRVRMRDFAPVLRSSLTNAPAELDGLVDGNTNITVSLPQPEPGRPSFIEIEFPAPFVARQLTLNMPLAGDQIVHGWLQASDDGQAWRDIREFDVLPYTQLFNFAETSARFFRILFPSKNADVENFLISEIELSPRCRIEGIEAKALFVRKYSYPGPSQFPGRAQYPNLPTDLALDPNRILDLSSKMTPDGRLHWQMPTGSWTILRFGHTSTGEKNHPSPEAGRGLECDKLSTVGADAAFDGFLRGLLKQMDPADRKIVTSTHIDSWEVGTQNWTRDFPAQFRKSRGYDVLKWLPALTGRVIGNFEQSERFLWDYRQTISDLLAENYAGRFRQLANRNGLKLSIEAYDGPCDDLTYAGQADEPTAEFWTIPSFEMAHTCTEMSSAAHVYGRRIVGAEAFTENMAQTWNGHPYSIKTFGDWAFCEGINRLVVHCYLHQPWTAPDRVLGMQFPLVGLHYQRTETWWKNSRPWNDYLARCQYLLQQGTFVADICHLAPEMAPRHWYNPDRSGKRGGYNFDVCTAEVLINRMAVSAGKLVLPDGMSYRLLALPQSETMTPKLLRRIRDLVEAGATVVGPPPLKSPSLSDYPDCDQEIPRLAAELWGRCDGKTILERSYGAGRVFWGPSPEEVLARDGIESDFVSANKSGTGVFQYIHRHTPQGELYFVSNPMLQPQEAVCGFRMSNARPELWDPESGEIHTPAVYNSDKTTRIPLQLGPAGSVFVMFPKGSKPEKDRIVAVLSNTTPLLETALPEPVKRPPLPNVTNNFTFAVWAKPGIATTLSKEAVFGKGEYWNPRNDALYPPHAHFIYHSPEHACAGLAIGTNGVCVSELSADYWGTPLVYAIELTNWTHVAVVYREGRPSLYLNGKLVHEGLRSRLQVHCGVEVPQMRGSPPFVGELGTFFHEHRVLEDEEIRSLNRRMPVPEIPAEYPSIDLITAKESWVAESSQGGTFTFQMPQRHVRRIESVTPAAPFDLSQDWDLSFPIGWGAPDKVHLDHLSSWKDLSNKGIRYFSGSATYLKTFNVPEDYFSGHEHIWLDLGRVAIMARVTLNGKAFAPLWKPPFRIDVTGLLKREQNVVTIEVVNLLKNRVIGDEQLPEDSNRKPDGSLAEWPKWLQQNDSSPTGRFTFSNFRLWQPDTPLEDSGLLGPVRLVAVTYNVVPKRGQKNRN